MDTLKTGVYATLKTLYRVEVNGPDKVLKSRIGKRIFEKCVYEITLDAEESSSQTIDGVHTEIAIFSDMTTAETARVQLKALFKEFV